MTAQPRPFGLMFAGLAAPDDDRLAREIGKPFGPMHSSGQGGNERITAGFTYLGQLIDHDLTFDASSSLARPANPNAVQNFRTAAFDLDSIYGLGPAIHSHLYNPQDPRKLAVEQRGQDVPRLGSGVAVIGDPRNDDNVIVSQLLTAFINFHNEVVDQIGGTFEEAQRSVQWHYQWIVLHKYLPKIVGFSTQHIFQNSPQRFWYGNNPPFIPVEFSLAAFRFGHSQIRARYDINSDVQGKGLSIFPDLDGHQPVPPLRRVDWSFFFNSGGAMTAQPSLPIHPFLAAPLFSMPAQSLGLPPNADPVLLSLAYRDIRRGQLRDLPSGHDIAAKIGLKRQEIVPADLIWSKVKQRLVRAGSQYDPTGQPVPLFLYVLFEAQELANSKHLGPLAGRIVSDVFIGLLKGDPDSFLSVNPNWTPQFGSNGDFDITDLLELARQQQNKL